MRHLIRSTRTYRKSIDKCGYFGGGGVKKDKNKYRQLKVVASTSTAALLINLVVLVPADLINLVQLYRVPSTPAGKLLLQIKIGILL